jgi:hypothetical protein
LFQWGTHREPHTTRKKEKGTMTTTRDQILKAAREIAGKEKFVNARLGIKPIRDQFFLTNARVTDRTITPENGSKPFKNYRISGHDETSQGPGSWETRQIMELGEHAYAIVQNTFLKSKVYAHCEMVIFPDEETFWAEFAAQIEREKQADSEAIA